MAAPQNFVSVSRRPPDVEDYIDMLRRYRSWVIGPTFAGLVFSVVTAFFWPNMYVCTAAMQIKPSAVSNGLLPTGMSGQMQTRLEQLNLEITGRDNLITLIKMPKLDLYEKERQRYAVEDVAEETFRKRLHIVPIVTGERNNGAQAFRISFEYPDRIKAQKLVMELISEFQSRNMALQSSTASAQSTLVDDLVKNAKDRWDKAQADLAAFTSQNQGRLPENFGANQMEVANRQNQIAAVNQRVADENQKQLILESNLANNLNQQAQTEQNLNTVETHQNQTVKDQNMINIESQISQKKAECASLATKYQPGYPRVLACQDEAKTLEDRKASFEKTESAAPGPGTTSRTVINSQVYQQLQKLKEEESAIRSQLAASKLNVQNYQRQYETLAKLLAEAQERIVASPAIIQQYQSLQQEITMARDDYKDKSEKRQTAGTEVSINEHQAGETLEILENAILPEKPTSPIRPAIIGLGTVVGLVFGIALAGAKEVKNTSLKNLKDVRAYTNLPVLSSIPLLENALLVRRKRRLAWLAWSSAVIVGSIMMSGAMYYYFFLSNQVS